MSKQALRIPRRTVFVNLMNSLISSLKMQAENPRTLVALNRDMSLRRVLGFPLPTWQRKPTWSKEQMARFIVSVYRGEHFEASSEWSARRRSAAAASH
jgi:hypothetical protein